jgi:hypothetical protein
VNNNKIDNSKKVLNILNENNKKYEEKIINMLNSKKWIENKKNWSNLYNVMGVERDRVGEKIVRDALCCILGGKMNNESREKIIDDLNTKNWFDKEKNRELVDRILGPELSEDRDYSITEEKDHYIDVCRVLYSEDDIDGKSMYSSMSIKKKEEIIHHIHPLMAEFSVLFDYLPLAAIATLFYHPPLHSLNPTSFIQEIQV